MRISLFSPLCVTGIVLLWSFVFTIILLPDIFQTGVCIYVYRGGGALKCGSSHDTIYYYYCLAVSARAIHVPLHMHIIYRRLCNYAA